MTSDITKRMKRLIENSWFITLFATTLGVLLAFYLSNINDRLKIENRKSISVQNISSEILNNEAQLQDQNDNKRLIDFLGKVKQIDHEFSTTLKTSAHRMNSLKMNFPEFIALKDSSILGLNQIEYDVAYTFELNLDDLQKIAWETFKMSDVSNELKYSCLQTLVRIYSLQEIYTKEQQKILNFFVNAEHNKLLGQLRIIQQLKSQLLNAMKEGEEEIKICNES